ncbi:MAG: NADP-dependent malic enzyme [Alphaproteobacteria bacterium]|nr:NADP-dependent malic enzyme [Alphaproteobacteria bacterium]
MAEDFKKAALDYHEFPAPGKIAVVPTKPVATQRDLSLAYSPGVAHACELIQQDPKAASRMTARQNLVGVVSNGTAVLGLGAIGPLASKPVMEGKGVLFKKFANIDVFDIEVDETDVDKFCDVVAALEPTFGGINLEDIKAPECFEIERRLRDRMKIPVFHDDQHGTAIIVAAAILNGLKLQDRKIEEVKMVVSGAGAAAIACLNLLVSLGMRRENIWVCDIVGLVYEGREEQMDPYKAAYAQKTDYRTLADVIDGANVFLGLSAPGVLKPELLGKMAARPVVMALANPVPEIMPDLARQTRPDAIIGTGRSDYPNQVNNVLCFPFLFRGALDVGATTINEEMKIAAVKAIADMATKEVSDVVATTYSGEELRFGPDYIIPKPFDQRLIVDVSAAVAQAAMDSGVAREPIEDMDRYREQLSQYVFKTGFLMKPVFERARSAPRRVVFAEGEDTRVLRACQQLADENIGVPVVIGRPEVIDVRLRRAGLRLEVGKSLEVVDPGNDRRFADYWRTYHRIMGRRGVSTEIARLAVRSNPTVIGALMLEKGDADALICGTSGSHESHRIHLEQVIGLAPGVRTASALSILMLSSGLVFMTDTHCTADPGVDDVVEAAILAACYIRSFGVDPKAALLSYSNFGTREGESPVKMRKAAAVLRARAAEFDMTVDGEMHADAAIFQQIRERQFPNCELRGSANLLVMPDLDAAHISFNLLKSLTDGISVGPMLLGMNRPAHVVSSSVTVRGLVNAAALAVVDVQRREAGDQVTPY